MSAIVTVLDVPDMTAAQYDQVTQCLNAMGQTYPCGRLYHVVSAKQTGGCQMVDVWESRQNFHQFAGALMPTLIKHGVNPPAPQITLVHDMFQ